ncbi:hypothetical protein [Streptosporangium roseum]|uniref:hypothetical protein n=1 Tax=Streptosporangium roseum TaxID=2001 RepID=UPI003323D850
MPEPRPAAWWIVPVALLVGGTVTAVAWWLLGSLPALPNADHSWPAGWTVVVQPDGTGRLEQVSKGTTANGAPGG